VLLASADASVKGDGVRLGPESVAILTTHAPSARA
jgi:hypothetical protein